MSVDQPRAIDFLSDNKNDKYCVVGISDHLEWDNRDHLIALQDKLNNYLAFIESGEIYDSRPDAREQEIEICLNCKFTPITADDIYFLQFAKNTIQKAGFRFSVIADNNEFSVPKVE